MNKNILLIQFSSRKQGNCAAIAQYIANYHNEDRVSCFVVDSNTMPACGNCDYECLKAQENCPNLTAAQRSIFDAICCSDIVYLILPNYCGFPCASYFAFNERSVGYFNMDRALMQKYLSVRKHFIVVSNTEGANFEMPLTQQVTGTPDILYLKTSKYGKKSIAGDMLDSDIAKADLKAYLDLVTI